MDSLALIIFGTLVVFLGLTLLGLSRWLSGSKTDSRGTPYESGMKPVDAPSARLDIKYFKSALFFLVFQSSILLLYPWVLTYGKSAEQLFLLFEFALLITIILVAFVVLALNRGFDWGRD